MVMHVGSKIQIKVDWCCDNPFKASKKEKTSLINSADAGPFNLQSKLSGTEENNRKKIKSK